MIRQQVEVADVANRPSFQFYPGDWMKDPNLRRCSHAARGFLMDMLCLMHECDAPGVLATADEPWPEQDIVVTINGDPVENLRLLNELKDKRVISRTTNGAIFSRRMVRDEETRRERVEAGAKGGEATAKQNRSKRPSKTAAKDIANLQQTGQQKGGSSSSSSSSTSVNSPPPNPRPPAPTPEVRADPTGGGGEGTFQGGGQSGENGQLTVAALVARMPGPAKPLRAEHAEKYGIAHTLQAWSEVASDQSTKTICGAVTARLNRDTPNFRRPTVNAVRDAMRAGLVQTFEGRAHDDLVFRSSEWCSHEPGDQLARSHPPGIYDAAGALVCEHTDLADPALRWT